MTFIIILVAVVVVAAIIGLIIYSSRHGEVKDDLQSRLEEYASMSGQVLTLEEIELSQPFYQRIIQPMRTYS